MRFLLALMLAAAVLQPGGWSQQASTPKAPALVKVTVQGASNLLADFIKNMEREFDKQGMKLELVQRGGASDYNIIVSQDSSFEGAAAAVIALDKNCNLIASVIKADRLSGKGALNASAKELAKKIAVLRKIT